VTTASIEATVADGPPLDAQMRQSQAMNLGDLAGWVAHEFNNVLQVIQGYTAIAADPDTVPGEQAAALRRVLDATDAAAELTGQLLALAGRQPLQLRDTDLASTARDLLPRVRRLAGEQIDTRCVTAERVASVRCDRVQIEQVLLTLCADACDAMPGGGRLTVSVDEARTGSAAETPVGPARGSAGFVRLRVADSREPMSGDARRRIVEPFRSDRFGGRGHGLGLAIAHGVIGRHDGLLDVDSDAGGTTFTILLPVSSAKQDIQG
jgi:signal transduction histidine kinase